MSRAVLGSGRGVTAAARAGWGRSPTRRAQSSILGVRAATGPVPMSEQVLPNVLTLWLPWDRRVLGCCAGRSVFCTSICQEGVCPENKVPSIPGASQCLLVVSFMAMLSTRTAMAAAAASPRRTSSSLVTTAVTGGDVASVASWASSWYVGPSVLVMPVSTTPFCASTPAARRAGQCH